MRSRFVWVLALVAVLPAGVRANVKPHALCSDGMVLQQKSKVKVWGKADPQEEVTVSFRGQKQVQTADDKGNWVVTLDGGAAGGPFDMTLAGKNKLNYKQVFVGEVWIASGQSNMEWTVNGSGKLDIEKATTAPANPMLRVFTVPRIPSLTPVSDIGGNWVEANPKTVGNFTSVGYFFGRDLQEKLKVPVGVIHTSWGGTRAEAWTRKEVLDAEPRFSHEHKNLARSIESAKDDPAKQKKVLQSNTASALYNGMVAPLLNTTIRGAIWYQGESNAGRAYDYRTLFPLMIKNWREDFKQGDFPFYFVQLAPFTAIAKTPGNSDWAELREAQTMTLKLPRTGMAVITDLGSEHDIHPTPKHPVGQRLALVAENQVYGLKNEFSGPMFKEMKVDGTKAVVTFDHAAGGLVAKEMVATAERKYGQGQVMAEWRVKEGSEGAPLTGFTIAGADNVFHPAKAAIQGDTVVVESDKVGTPVAVRFGWANHPVVNLFNRAGLPASPFRTDDLPGVTQPRSK